MSVSAALALAALVTTIAAIVDIRSRRIPNWLTLSAVALGVLVNVWQTGVTGLLTALAGIALGLGVLLPFYCLRAIGAGDVKLLAAVGALAGPQLLVSVALYGAVVGGVLAAVMLVRCGRLMTTLNDILVRRTLPSHSGVTAPYGVAIASGVYLTLVLPGVIR